MAWAGTYSGRVRKIKGRGRGKNRHRGAAPFLALILGDATANVISVCRPKCDLLNYRSASGNRRLHVYELTDANDICAV